MNRKGFAPLIIVLIIAAVLVVGGVSIFYYTHSSPTLQNSPQQSGTTSIPLSAQTPISPVVINGSPTSIPNGAATGWEIYINSKYGFQITYPINAWYASITNNGIDLALYSPEASDAGMSLRFTATALPQYQGKSFTDIYKAENFIGSNSFNKDCTQENFAGAPAYGCKLSYEGTADVILLQKNDLTFEIYDAIQDVTSSKMISSFKFIQSNP